MKTILTSLTLLLLTVLPVHARRGIVVAHYGSSNDSTRALTIDKITDEIAQAAGAEIPVVQAIISPVVRRSMARKGLQALSPVDAMLRLRADGVDTLIVQPSLIIDGGEMELVKADVESVRPFFSEVKLGRPLCYTPADFENLVSILADEDKGDCDAIIFVGHGNELPSTATYTQLDYMLADRGLANYHVSTIEGFPTADTTARQLQRTSGNIKKVKLVPLLLVCGNHTINDIAGDYAARLSQLGYTPRVLKRGLAELPAIRQLYVNRLTQLLIGN